MNEPVNLVFKKEIDYSIFYQGTTIAREYHPLIDRAIKNHLDLGESIDIKLLFDSNEFTARIRNAKRDVNGDSYQLRYDSNTELISRIQNKFPDVYKKVLEIKKNRYEKEHLKRPRVSIKNVYFELWTTEILNTFFLKIYDNNIPFKIGETYKRSQIYDILEVPTEKRRGRWETGYHHYNNNSFIFSTIGTPTTTGHDYGDHWIGDDLLWRGRKNLKRDWKEIQKLIYPLGYVFIFTREDNHSPFTYNGVGNIRKITDTIPVTIIWTFSNPNERRMEQIPEEEPDLKYLYEGKTKQITVNIYERNPQARKKCIEYYGTKCSVCNFDFEEKYGSLGKGFIHVHHIIPLSQITKEYRVDPIKDLRPICPNCHAMIHLSNVEIDKLKYLLLYNITL